jgi:hypothetical protein
MVRAPVLAHTDGRFDVSRTELSEVADPASEGTEGTTGADWVAGYFGRGCPEEAHRACEAGDAEAGDAIADAAEEVSGRRRVFDGGTGGKTLQPGSSGVYVVGAAMSLTQSDRAQCPRRLAVR